MANKITFFTDGQLAWLNENIESLTIEDIALKFNKDRAKVYNFLLRKGLLPKIKPSFQREWPNDELNFLKENYN